MFDLTTVPNGEDLDPHFGQFQWLGEIERRYELWSHPGKIAVTGFLTRARLGTYEDAIALAQVTGGPADIAAVRQYRSRTGLSVNLEQEITADLGAVRARRFCRRRYRAGFLYRHRSHRGCRLGAEGHPMGPPRRHVRGWPPSSTASPKRTRRSSMTAAWAFWSATAYCRIRAWSRSSRPIISFRFILARDVRLSVRRQSGL